MIKFVGYMRIYFVLLLVLIVTSCGSKDIPMPKPPTYLRADFPDKHEYVDYKSQCGYQFKVSKLFKVKDVYDSARVLTCHKDIDLGKLNGVVNFSYIIMNEPLSMYVNYANDKVDEHKIKATAINDLKIMHPDHKVYGTFFELQGDVASPFQFYLTDSTTRFVSGVVYLNSRPNYDSLRPTLEYLKVDLLELVNTFEWK